jgi:NADH dehydrogenase [ubiquinone] 1 alpha subcomplex assembly factor 5
MSSWSIFLLSNLPQSIPLKGTRTQSLRVSLSLGPLHFKYAAENERLVQVERRVVDEEKLLHAIPRNSQEAIVSCLSLHWVNDLPGKQLHI